MPGIFVQASAESNLFGLCRVQPKISKKWHYATGPASIIHPPHCISDNSCDRPGRHLSYCNYSCPFVQFVGKNISLRTSARKRQLQVVPSCPRCRHIPHCISVDSCDRPGRHLSIATIRVNFFDIFGCARHNSNKFGFALACTKIRAIRGQ